ncbi:hypothetical protein P4H71_04435 [Paenibacillus kribbensis]|uniref:XkdQ/YqbQ family protein n=1 Tax=Paenibacillus kribbensis TaxID=172713 RepID=UPI002DBCF5E2|nr:hypothetical protein [Paenibacillus kribbensis]MEC0233603.1 hypothetical protein [Paenibacillus kribbensis]
MDIFIDNRDGNVWQVSGEAMAGKENAAGLVSELTWKTERTGSPGSVDITLVKDGIYQNKKFKVQNGDIVRITKGKYKIFYGYVFSVEQSEKSDMKITAYDQIRYLNANDTYVFKNLTAGAVIKRIAEDFKLKTGMIADTGYKIPAMVEDNQKLLDIIYKAIDQTLMSTGTIYVFYDDFGALALKRAADMLVSVSVGDGSLMTGYALKKSIDSETYNYVKLVQDNKESGKRDAYVYQDGNNIKKWGKLQLYDKVDEKMNAAQIKQKAQNLLTLHNRESKSLSIDAMGDLSIRAGCYVPVFVADLKVSQVYLVDSCTHKFSGLEHTMSLELKVI